jgi:hypothetical protein
MSAKTGRTYTLLLGIGAAGAAIWIAARIGGQATWRYWAVLGVLAGAGFAFALSQRTAYGAWAGVAPAGFLVALVVAVVCVGWIAAVGEPHSNWFRGHFSSWSSDLGVRNFVEHMTAYVSVIAFGFGALLASAPVAVRRTRPAPAAQVVEQPAPPPPAEFAPVDGNGYTAHTPEHTRV